MTKKIVYLLTIVISLGLSTNLLALGNYVHLASVNPLLDPVRGVCQSVWEDQAVYQIDHDCVLAKGLGQQAVMIDEKTNIEPLFDATEGEEFGIVTYARQAGCYYCTHNQSEFEDSWGIGYFG